MAKRFSLLRIFIALFLIVFVFFVGSAVYIFVKYKPYFTMPDVDEAYLEAKMKEYRAFYDGFTNRPDDDKEALTALLDTVNTKDDEYVEDFCDEKQRKKLATIEPRLKDFTPLFDQLDQIAKDGLVFRIEKPDPETGDTDIPNFLPLRILNYNLLAAAVLEVNQEKGREAIQRFDLSARAIEGMYNSPLLISVMIGTSMAKAFDNAVVYILPKLPEEDLKSLHDTVLAKRPDTVEKIVDALKLEACFIANATDVAFNKGKDDLKTKQFIKDQAGWGFAALASMDWFVRRERLCLWDDQITRTENYVAWLKDRSAPLPPDFPADEKAKGLLEEIARPAISKIVQKAIASYALDQATQKAVEAELSVRKSGRRIAYKVKVDENRTIVVDGEKGCIIDKTKEN